MPFTSHIDEENGIVIHRGSGMITFEEVRHELERFFAETPTLHSLWDLCEADLSCFNTVDFRVLLNFVKQHADKRAESGAKTAFAAKHPATYGICRMILSISDTLPYPRMVYYTMEEALNWIKGSENPDAADALL
jgi:hypothetical protein